jgi:hypothetical protein
MIVLVELGKSLVHVSIDSSSSYLNPERICDFDFLLSPRLCASTQALRVAFHSGGRGYRCALLFGAAVDLDDGVPERKGELGLVAAHPSLADRVVLLRDIVLR